jgi:spore germination protein
MRIGVMGMNREKHELLTSGQLIGLLVGFVLGPGFLSLPNLLTETVHQDGWVSAIIALVYPIYIVLISSYIAKIYPKDDILNINRSYFGNIFGNILNIIFGLQFLIYIATITSEFVLIARLYIVAFLTPTKIIILCLIITALAASKGVKTLGKIGEVTLYFILPAYMLTLFVFADGDFGNIKPVFEHGVVKILTAAEKTIYYYGGFEALLLIHPYVRSSVNIKAASLKAVGISGLIWVWTVFSTIFYAGVETIPKSLWSFFLVFNSINFPIINNVRYVFMFVWAIVSFRIISNYIFLIHRVINDISKVKMEKAFYITIPILGCLTYRLMDVSLRSSLLEITSPLFVYFNILLLTIITLLARFKRKNIQYKK